MRLTRNSILCLLAFIMGMYTNIAQAQSKKNGGIIVSQNEHGGLLAAPNDIGPFSYSQAIYQCSCYKLNGIGDWRMPSQSELKLLYQKRSSIGGFNSSYVYWSTTRDNSVSNTAWYIDFNDGEQAFGRYDYGSSPVRCVRNFTNDEKEVSLSAQDLSYFKGLHYKELSNDFSNYEGLYVYCTNGKPRQTELPDGTVDYSYALINRNGVVYIADGPDFISAFSVAREETGIYTTNGFYKRTKTTLEQKAKTYKQITSYRLSTISLNGNQKIIFATTDDIIQWSYDIGSKSFLLEAKGANAAQLTQNLQRTRYSVNSLKFVSSLD
jgi:hypothetical protein